MTTVRKEADEIQQQMALIRSELRQEMRGVVKVAVRATDWHSYVKNRPFLAIGVAFAAGYLVVPRKAKSVAAIVAETRQAIPEPLVPTVKTKTKETEKKGAVRWLFGLVAPLVLRAAQAYATSYVEGLLTTSSTPPPPDVRPGPERRSQTTRT